MKSYKGILFIFITMFASAMLWTYATPFETIHAVNKLSHIVGGIAITMKPLNKKTARERGFHPIVGM